MLTHDLGHFQRRADSWQGPQVGREGQGVQGTLGGMERGVGDVEEEAGGAQTGMAEPQLDATQVDRLRAMMS